VDVPFKLLRKFLKTGIAFSPMAVASDGQSRVEAWGLAELRIWVHLVSRFLGY
jgi:hypothetical protein